MSELNQLEGFVWEMPKEGNMNVPARLYVDKEMIETLKEEEKTNWSTLRQLRNVASLQGIQKHAIALSDCHPGYGAPIGGVAAFDLMEGLITFGIVGFDINCGVRTLRTNLTSDEINSKKKELSEALFNEIPAGLGVKGKLELKPNEIDELLEKGAEYVVEKGFGLKNDLEFIEEKGCVKGANPENVSMKAKQRQFKQIGTLGSGNHYLEVQEVEEIFDEKTAKAFGLKEKECVVSIHCGSRALGHQIGTDYLEFLEKAAKKYKIKIPDKELVCAPIQSKEGQKYFSAVNAGINCAFANRQMLTHLTRTVFSKVFELEEKQIQTLYDVGHNTAKIEKHEGKKLLVQRKGATRGFGAGREEIPEKYRAFGQPVLIGGSMGTNSFILSGTEKAMHETFGSTIHGAGRSKSRVAAKKEVNAENVIESLNRKGIIVKGHSMKGIEEEAPSAYKNILEVVEVVHKTGISKKTVKLKPLICIKG
ncbi:MAG: RtcB family protein [Candidatus Diapherotrites archaeon]|nr:RtcB family protein [Candidatus Diapherotrites archaeon]